MSTYPKSVTVQEFATWRTEQQDVALLDVREPWEVEICAIDGAITIPLQQIPGRIAELPTDRPLVVMCHHGMRSQNAVNWLSQNGMTNVINLEGGIGAWAAQIDPTMRTY